MRLDVAPGGIAVGGATIETGLRRDPPTPGGGLVGDLIIDTDDVDHAIADDLEATFDGNADLSAGTIRWTDAGGGRGTLSFAIPIRGC